MSQVARWYDVDVVYEGDKPDNHFSGIVSRDISLSKLLEIIEIGGIHFRIEGKKIIVLKHI
ncbi:MAG: DUF4974 domain-containing protein [Salinivirgaceae bacterium]|nr:DUF4974 domain-containing protein [Salinivirgaceae bacterium]